MARKKSFLAEMQRQVAASQRKAESAQKAAAREHQAAVRRAEQAVRAEERAAAQAAKATEAERKQLLREAEAARVAARLAEVEELNAALAETYDAIDSLLAATLEVDDYVDLEGLRRTVDHPPFDRTDLESPVPEPVAIPDPEEPQYQAPPPPSGVFGKKKKLAEAESKAKAKYEASLAEWKQQMERLPASREAAAAEHRRSEAERLASLDRERARYEQECSDREAEALEHNAAIDTLVANLGYGTVEAVEEYVSIVLSNSVYPDEFNVSHEFEFDPRTAELRLRALVPGPDTVPAVKAYRYTKASDEITSTSLSQKASKDRYLSAIQQVALRSMHEVFEADRRGLIRMISLELGTDTIDPATGHPTYVPFVAVAAERQAFMSFDLASVTPQATLEHLGASVSKNPFGLVAATTTGVRSS